MSYYLLALKKYAVFSGRATRSEYWYFFLVNFLISMVINVLSIFGSQSMEALIFVGIFYNLFIFIPGLSLCVRRLHDIGKSGWMIFISLIPFIGIIWLIVLLCKKSEPSENQYGPAFVSQVVS